MLKGVHPLLGPDLLHVLASMGHGDELALVDRNFPAVSHATRIVPMLGADMAAASEAILSVLPLDSFVPEPVLRMEVVGEPNAVPPVQQEFVALCRRAEGREVQVGSLPRKEFYRRAGEAFAVVTTSEPRAYSCFLLVKGVIHD